MQAEDYPARPVRIIVATTAGGGTDIAARLLAQWLSEKLGQSFFVENRPGGNNNIGTELAARSAPDGYTLLMANSVNTINAVLYDKLSFDFIADFAPVVHVLTSPLLMMVHPSVSAKSVPEFITFARAAPDRISMGSGGSGSTGHMAGELFMMMAGVRMVHVPYRGESVAITDLLAGQPQVLFATTGSSLSFAKSGVVRTLAVTTPARIGDLPDVPAMAEFLSGYEANGWNGLCAPRNIPEEVVALLNRQINAALVDPGVRERLASLGGTAPGGSPAQFAQFIAGEIEKWGRVAKFTGTKLN